MSEDGERLAGAIDHEGERSPRDNEPFDSRHIWKNVPDGLRFGSPQYRHNYEHTKDGWREHIVLVNRDGFQKQEWVTPDAKHYRIMRAMKLSEAYNPFAPDLGSLTYDTIIFERTSERTPKEGIEIFREV